MLLNGNLRYGNSDVKIEKKKFFIHPRVSAIEFLLNAFDFLFFSFNPEGLLEFIDI